METSAPKPPTFTPMIHTVVVLKILAFRAAKKWYDCTIIASYYTVYRNL